MCRYVGGLHAAQIETDGEILVSISGIPLVRQIFVGASGSTLTAQEKYAAIAMRVNETGEAEAEGWMEVTRANIETKIDNLKRKGKKIYKTFRTKTKTGAPVDEYFDLEVWCL